jgi:CheY-like chemotaxis protein
VELPLVVATNTDRREKIKISQHLAAKDEAPSTIYFTGRILLAEDSLDIQKSMVFFLKKAGASVDVAADGRIAIDMIERANSTGCGYELLLTDMQMPNMDGYELVSRLRSNGWTLPIIALTAYSMVEDRQQCLDAGCNDYISKPIDRRALLRTCQTWIERRSPSV